MVDIRAAVAAASKAMAFHRALSASDGMALLAFCELLTADLEEAHPQAATALRVRAGFGRTTASANVLVVDGPLAGDDVAFPLTRVLAEPLVAWRHALSSGGDLPPGRRPVPADGVPFLSDFLSRLATEKGAMTADRVRFDRLWPAGGPDPAPGEVALTMPELALHFPSGVLPAN